MDWLQGWNLGLLAIAVYVAVMALVRLMRQRRDQLVSEVQQQIDARRQQMLDRRDIERQFEASGRPSSER